HAWDFVDAPLAYQAFFGGQYKTDGVQLKWVAPTEHYVELGGEIGNSDPFPGSPRSKNGVGSGMAYARTGGDIGESHSWLAGVSYVETGSEDRVSTRIAPTGDDLDVAFTGKSKVVAADFVWKYAPNGNPLVTNFKLQGEYLWRKEDGNLAAVADGAPIFSTDSPYRSRQSGWYVPTVYQFEPIGPGG